MLSTRSSRLKLSPDTFIPRKKIWVIVQNKDYSLARSSKSLKTLNDMNDADEKVQSVIDGIHNLGAVDADIRLYENATRKDFVGIFDQLTLEVRLEESQAEQIGEQSATLIFFYYIGHGIMQNLTSVLVNDKSGIWFPLERSLRILGENKNTYVLSILDCSRYQVGGLTQKDEKVPEADTNCMITFAQAANCSKHQSKLSVEYFRTLWSFADPTNGSLLLPCNEFYRWRSPGNNGEHFIQTTRDMLLVFEQSVAEHPTFHDIKTMTLQPDQIQSGGAEEFAQIVE